MIATSVKVFFGFIGLVMSLYFLQLLFWFLYNSYWDYRVTRMCSDDGGVVIYEKIALTKTEANNLNWAKNFISVPSDSISNVENFPYLARRTSTNLKEGIPEIVRNESVFYRVEDGADLGKFVTYSRIGSGAVLSFIETSSFSCSDMVDIALDIENQIFKIE